MIYGNINVKETENAYSPTIRKALEILRTKDVSQMHHGKYPLEEDRLFMQINEITTAPKEQCRAESHKKYIDVQFMVHGNELIGFYPNQNLDDVQEDLTEERDIIFYNTRAEEKEIMLPMTDGCYAVFFPEDVHRPGCMMDAPEDIKKIVLKIRVDTL